MTGIWLAAFFFLFVMGAIVAAGYFVVLRKPEPAGAQDFHAGAVLESVGGWVAGSAKSNDTVRKRLAAAGYTQASALGVFYGIRCATAVVLFFAVAIVALIVRGEIDAVFLPAMCGAGMGYYLPGRLLGRRIQQRKLALQRALPTALELYVLSIEAGQSLDQGLNETSRSLARSFPELSQELERVYLEARASNNRAAALRALADRTEEPEVRKVVSLLTDADRFGASISPALRTHSRYLRTRLRQDAHETARKIGVKLIFPVFFLIFPAVVLITLGPACIMVFTQLSTLLGN